MRKWLAQLIAGSSGTVDEAALFIALVCLMWGLVMLELNALELVAILVDGAMLDPLAYAEANAALFVSAGTAASLVVGFMGYRDKYTPPPESVGMMSERFDLREPLTPPAPPRPYLPGE